MTAPDPAELLARIGAELGFLTPVEPCPWPGDPTLAMAVEDRPPGRRRIVVALGPDVAAAIAANLGTAASAGEIAGELANVVAGHLLPALPGDAGGFLPPVPWTGAPGPWGRFVGVRFTEGCIGLAILEDDPNL
jgi:hypothetical protein